MIIFCHFGSLKVGLTAQLLVRSRGKRWSLSLSHAGPTVDDLAGWSQGRNIVSAPGNAEVSNSRVITTSRPLLACMTAGPVLRSLRCRLPCSLAPSAAAANRRSLVLVTDWTYVAPVLVLPPNPDEPQGVTTAAVLEARALTELLPLDTEEGEDEACRLDTQNCQDAAGMWNRAASGLHAGPRDDDSSATGPVDCFYPEEGLLLLGDGTAVLTHAAPQWDLLPGLREGALVLLLGLTQLRPPPARVMAAGPASRAWVLRHSMLSGPQIHLFPSVRSRQWRAKLLGTLPGAASSALLRAAGRALGCTPSQLAALEGGLARRMEQQPQLPSPDQQPERRRRVCLAPAPEPAGSQEEEEEAYLFLGEARACLTC